MKKHLTKMLLTILFSIGLSGWASAQYTVSGKITDEKSEPLVGVSIVEKGTTNGTISDIDGNYKIVLKSNNPATLVVTFVGFGTKELPVKSGSTLDIQMEESSARLEEVVVTGLATNIKRANAGTSVARLNADELTGNGTPTTLDGAMSGKLAGANIVSNSGAPGGGVSVKLRGISTITGSSEPLYVIDGIIVNNSQFQTGAGTGSFNGATSASTGSQDQAVNRIADINPADIESIDVLKGPAAAAIYGTRANAGVIVIQTKRGKIGKTIIKLNQDYGVATATNLLKSEDWTEQKIKDYGGYYGQPDVDAAIAEFKAAKGQTWDYDKLFFGETGTISNTNLSISGGNEKTRYLVSGGYNNEKGIMLNTGYKRISARVNIDHRINDWIDIKTSSAFYSTESSRSFLGNDNNGVSIGYTYSYVPNFVDITPKTDANGVTTYPLWRGTNQNPFEVRDRLRNDDISNRFLNSGEINFKLISNETSNLKFSIKGGADYALSQPRVYAPEDVAYQKGLPNPGAYRLSTNKALYSYIQSFLTYNYKIGGVDLTSQIGVLRNVQITDQNWIQGAGLLPKQTNPSTAKVVTSQTFQDRAIDVATDFSQDFNWGDKVIGRVGVRFDKSSLNGDNTKWFPFPRASMAVNLANFEGIKGGLFSQIKPRVAFGRTGGVAPYGALYTALGAINYNGALGSVAPSTNGNNLIQPETAQELEFGLDLGILKDRITLEMSYYNKTVFDLLFAFPLSTATGVTSIRRFPIGDISNKGIEIGLNATILKNTNVSWTSTVQFWINKSKLERLTVPSQNAGASFVDFGTLRLTQDVSPTAWWGRDENGVFFNTGFDAQPKFQLTWVNNLHFAKSFDFSMTWHTNQGNYISSLTRELKDEGGTTSDWSQNIKNLNAPRIAGNTGGSVTNYLFDASYIRLRNIALYYSVPNIGKLTNNKVANVRIGVSAQNYVTISDFLKYGYDPEASNFGNQPLGGSVDLAPFPASKRLSAHITLEF
jgi:TonB-linked SusC/RagA family outer membrane protein